MEKELLNKIADLIEVSGWTQGTYARDGAGNDVSPKDPLACSFCIDGAAISVAGAKGMSLVARVFARQGLGVVSWNDAAGRTQDEVVSKLRDFAQGVE